MYLITWDNESFAKLPNKYNYIFVPMLLSFVLYGKCGHTVTAALHEKDENDSEEEAALPNKDQMSKEFWKNQRK